MLRSSVLIAGSALMSVGNLQAQARPASPASPDSALGAASREVQADEAARIRGDSVAWMRVAPGFVFVHSTGGVDDLVGFQRHRAMRATGPARGNGATARQPVAPPVERLDGDVFVRVQLLGDSVAPHVQPGRTRVMDVYVRRDGAWHWLAHQSAEVSARWALASVAAADVAELAGVYVAANGQRRTYAVRGDSLVQVLERTPAAGPASAPPTGSAGALGAPEIRRLIPLGTGSFGYAGRNATVTFVRDRTGRVVGAAESAQVGFTEFRRAAP